MCQQAPSGSASAGWAEGLPEQHHALRSLDLSHTQIDHLELLRLMQCTRQLCTLKLNFCEQLREGRLPCRKQGLTRPKRLSGSQRLISSARPERRIGEGGLKLGAA